MSPLDRDETPQTRQAEEHETTARKEFRGRGRETDRERERKREKEREREREGQE